MKIDQIIINESSCGGSTAGGIATVAKPLGEVQKRVPVAKTSKKKGPYANSLSEGKMKDLSLDIKSGKDGLSDVEFKKKYGKSKDEMRKELQKKPQPKDKSVSEAKLEEEDKIIPVGKGKKLKTGLHGKNDKPKFTGFRPPFKSAGVFVSDKRGNKVCDCAAQELAPVIAKALNAYAIANESIMSGGVVASGMPGESVQENQDYDIRTKRVTVLKDKSGKPIGEIGIDLDASPGNGNWYVHHYATNYNVVGFDNAKEAKLELMYAEKYPEQVNEQGVAEGLPPHIKKSDLPPTMRSRLTMKDIEQEKPKGAYRYRVGDKQFMGLQAAQEFAKGTGQKVEQLNELSPETIKSYKEKARKSADELAAKKQFRKATDREMGIMRATGKEIEKTVGNIRKALGKK